MSCPICDRDTDKAYHPFCSKRCADIDLGRWFGGVYTLDDTEDDAGETSKPQRPRES